MGCENINTIEQVDNSHVPYNPTNIIIKQYTGFLTEDSEFKDTIIKSFDELNDKLRTYIPLKVKKPVGEGEVYNTKDEILTKATNVTSINFENNYILAVTGINKVNRVEEANGNYAVYHDNKPPECKRYIALVVKKIGIDPKIDFYPPKM